jgi:hypothetical protein
VLPAACLQWRLNKKIRKNELGASLKPCFEELGLSADLSGQFFYPPGGFRIWHTNCFDGLGWRGYIVHVDQDGKSALNVMKGDRMIHCSDKNAIFRLFRIQVN